MVFAILVAIREGISIFPDRRTAGKERKRKKRMSKPGKPPLSHSTASSSSPSYSPYL